MNVFKLSYLMYVLQTFPAHLCSIFSLQKCGKNTRKGALVLILTSQWKLLYGVSCEKLSTCSQSAALVVVFNPSNRKLLSCNSFQDCWWIYALFSGTRKRRSATILIDRYNVTMELVLRVSVKYDWLYCFSCIR